MIDPPVDLEALVVAYLKASRTGELAVGVADKLPRGWTPAEPYVRLTLFGGTSAANDPARWLARRRLQVDAYAADSAVAYELSAAAWADLANWPESEFETPGVTVTAVTEALGIRRRDDARTSSAGYSFDAIIHAHPAAP